MDGERKTCKARRVEQQEARSGRACSHGAFVPVSRTCGQDWALSPQATAAVACSPSSSTRLCAVALGHSRVGLKSSQNTFICLGIHFMCFELFWGSGRAGTVLLMRKLTVHQSRGETSTEAGEKTKGLRRRIASLMLLLRPKQALCCQAPHLLPLLAGGPHPVPGLQALLLLSGTWSWLPL